MTTGTLQLIDLENLTRSGYDYQLAHGGLATRLDRHSQTGDIIVIASCEGLFRRTAFALLGLDASRGVLDPR